MTYDFIDTDDENSEKDFDDLEAEVEALLDQHDDEAALNPIPDPPEPIYPQDSGEADLPATEEQESEDNRGFLGRGFRAVKQRLTW